MRGLPIKSLENPQLKNPCKYINCGDTNSYWNTEQSTSLTNVKFLLQSRIVLDLLREDEVLLNSFSSLLTKVFRLKAKNVQPKVVTWVWTFPSGINNTLNKQVLKLPQESFSTRPVR